MQRGQGDALLQSLHDLIGDEHGGIEGLAAVHHAVTHSVDFLHGADHAVLGVHQSIEHGLDGLGMGGHGHIHGVEHFLALYLGLIGELAVDADALAQALGQQDTGLGIEQLVLQRGTACVDDKNVHVFYVSSFSSFGKPLRGFRK